MSRKNSNEYYDEDLDENEIDDEYDKEGVIPVLSVLSVWFIRFGLLVGVVLFLYFIITGNIYNAFLYLLGLVIAYFFGYILMFCLDKFISVE